MTSSSGIKEAVTELEHAHLGFREALDGWGNAVTELHMAELRMREGYKRMTSAYTILNTLLPPEQRANGNKEPKL